MLLIIACTLLGIIAWVKIAHGFEDACIEVITFLIFAGIGALVGMCIASCITEIYSIGTTQSLDGYTLSENVSIAVLPDTTTGSKDIYAYQSNENIRFVKETDLGCQESYIPVSQTSFRYTDAAESPHMETWTINTIPYKLFAMPRDSSTELYLLYVPEGSIVSSGLRELYIE
jgi:hypothetical protein